MCLLYLTYRKRPVSLAQQHAQQGVTPVLVLVLAHEANSEQEIRKSKLRPTSNIILSVCVIRLKKAKKDLGRCRALPSVRLSSPSSAPLGEERRTLGSGCRGKCYVRLLHCVEFLVLMLCCSVAARSLVFAETVPARRGGGP